MRKANYLALMLLPLLASGCMMPNHQAQVAHNEKVLETEGILALKAGDQMPAIELSLPTTAGDPLVLSAAPPASPLLLFFYTADDTPNCAHNLTALNKLLPQLEQHGIRAYGVNPESLERHQSFVATNRLALPLASDEGGRAAQAFACMPAGGQYPQRTTVLIDTTGKIVLFQRGLAPVALILESLGISTKP